MGKIIWLASYPKSGNTWLRIFLANLLSESDRPVDFNQLKDSERFGCIASARAIFDREVGVESSDLTGEEIDRYRPRVYERISQEIERSGGEAIFMKIHDAFTRNAWGEPIVSKVATQGVIYLIRNPLDVAVSYAHHMACPLEKAANILCNSDYTLENTEGLSIQLRQRLLSWREHVISWVDEPDLPVHVMRYEDMQRRPLQAFRGAVLFAGLPDRPERLQLALDHSSFEQLQARECEKGFVEKPLKAKAFFRQGKIGSWRGVLSETQVEMIVRAHGDVMRRFGYLTDGDPSVGCRV